MEQEDRMLTLNVCYAFTDSGGEYYHHVLTSLVSVFENRCPERTVVYFQATFFPPL